MAEEDIELAPEKAKGSKLKLIIFVVAGMLVAGGATVGGLYAAGMLGGGGGGEEATAEAEPTVAEAVYVALDPSFTVNFEQGSARFLQLTLEAMTRNPAIEPEIRRHMPMIRNDLMLLFSAKNSDELGTRAGKEALQAETLASIQKVLERETGEPGIEAVYFTSFVMQ